MNGFEKCINFFASYVLFSHISYFHFAFSKYCLGPVRKSSRTFFCSKPPAKISFILDRSNIHYDKLAVRDRAIPWLMSWSFLEI